MNNLETNQNTGSMPIPMAVDSKLITDPPVAATGTAKDLDYFRREFQKTTLAFYRSTKKVADLLLEARITLSPGEFKQLVADELQFDPSTVYKLIKSAADFRLNDPKNQAILPEEWTVRYEIVMMKEETFRIGVKTGVVHAKCTLADLKTLRERLEEPKRKKANATAKTKGKNSTAATAETPKGTPAAAKAGESEPQAKKAAVKAPVNNPGLRVVESSSAAEAANTGTTATATAPALATATATLPVGRIAIVVGQEIAEQRKTDLDRLLAGIRAVVKEFDFIDGVEVKVEVAA
jgi:hypothetical protein